MTKRSKTIHLSTAFGTATVSTYEAVRILGVHPKTAERWANGTQRISRERAALLAILSGQVVPMPGWQGYQFAVKRGPAPNRAAFAVLISPDGRHWRADELLPLTRVRPSRNWLTVR